MGPRFCIEVLGEQKRERTEHKKILVQTLRAFKPARSEAYSWPFFFTESSPNPVSSKRHRWLRACHSLASIHLRDEGASKRSDQRQRTKRRRLPDFQRCRRHHYSRPGRREGTKAGRIAKKRYQSWPEASRPPWGQGRHNAAEVSEHSTEAGFADPGSEQAGDWPSWARKAILSMAVSQTGHTARLVRF